MKQKLERLTGMRQASAAVESPFDHSVNATTHGCPHNGMRKFMEEERHEKAHRQ